jgi:hypothetical protein
MTSPPVSTLTLVAKSQNPHSLAEVGPIAAEVPDGAGPFATSLEGCSVPMGPLEALHQDEI